jgi:hypothetical protein
MQSPGEEGRWLPPRLALPPARPTSERDQRVIEMSVGELVPSASYHFELTLGAD